MDSIKFFAMLVFCVALAAPLSAGGVGTYVFIPDNSNFMLTSGAAGTHTLTQHSRVYQRIHSHIRRLSSAQRITRAADDPAGLAVAEKMNGHLRQLKREMMNAADYRNFLNYKEAVIAENIEHIQRLRELVMRATGGLLAASDRELLQFEVEQLLRQIDLNARTATYNKKAVISGLTAEALGLDGFSVVQNPASKLEPLDKAQQKLISLRTRSGLESATLQLQIDGQQYYMLNLQAAESRIRDLDMGSGLVDFAKDMVLYHTSTGMILHAMH